MALLNDADDAIREKVDQMKVNNEKEKAVEEAAKKKEDEMKKAQENDKPSIL
jgi:hypothetical protein